LRSGCDRARSFGEEQQRKSEALKYPPSPRLLPSPNTTTDAISAPLPHPVLSLLLLVLFLPLLLNPPLLDSLPLRLAAIMSPPTQQTRITLLPPRFFRHTTAAKKAAPATTGSTSTTMPSAQPERYAGAAFMRAPDPSSLPLPATDGLWC